MTPKPNECCNKSENLKPQQLRPDLVVNVCQVCGRRHFEMTVDPGKFGVVGAPL
jgi:hypothetical protein